MGVTATTLRCVRSAPVPSGCLAVGVSIGVGVLLGRNPAQRAAKLDPIGALRHG
jgi:ABC-type antimicrobial peptide transport system permease subunit